MELGPGQRILEVGVDRLLARLMPDLTDSYAIAVSRGGLRSVTGPVLTRPVWDQLRRDLADGKYGLIALGSIKVGIWHAERPLGTNLNRFFKHLTFFPALAPHRLVRLARRHGVPVIAYDLLDTMAVAQPNFFLFPHVRCFFKRELPQNRWHAFLNLTRRNGDVSNIRRQAFFRDAVTKLRPLPLHIEPAARAYPKIRPEDKKTDIFYVGENPKTTVRTEGLKQMEALRAAGYAVDAPQERISRDEFYQRLSQAWLAWSPEGSGWECHRHYESLAHGAVPVMNYPTIERYRPLIDREHAFYYGVEGNGLQNVVRQALEDKERLMEMTRKGREHVQTAYTAEAIARYILDQI